MEPKATASATTSDAPEVKTEEMLIDKARCLAFGAGDDGAARRYPRLAQRKDGPKRVTDRKRQLTTILVNLIDKRYLWTCLHVVEENSSVISRGSSKGARPKRPDLRLESQIRAKRSLCEKGHEGNASAEFCTLDKGRRDRLTWQLSAYRTLSGGVCRPPSGPPPCTTNCTAGRVWSSNGNDPPDGSAPLGGTARRAGWQFGPMGRFRCSRERARVRELSPVGKPLARIFRYRAMLRARGG